MGESNKIITSLYIYNSTLFKARLDGKIEATPVPNKWLKYNNAQPYSLIIDIDKIVIEMQGYQGVLFVATSERLCAYNLKNMNNVIGIFEKDIIKCKSIKIDYKNQWLFIVSETRGVTVLDISNALKPKFLRDIELPFLQSTCDEMSDQYIITDFDVVNGVAFLAVRNKGIVRIDYAEGRFREPELVRTIDKIILDDPQDVRFCSENQYLYIVDSERGFIILDTRNNGVVYERNSFDGGTPKKLLLRRQDAIIQTGKGLYLFKFSSKSLEKVLDFKVGALSMYYNHIVFSKRFSTNILTLAKRYSYLDEEYKRQLDYFESVYTFDSKLERIK